MTTKQGNSEQSRCTVIHRGTEYAGKQGPNYSAGVSAETVGSRDIWLGLVSVPAGGRTKAHKHEHHETAIYVLSGEVDLWSGQELGAHQRAGVGDFIYIPAGVSHVAVNRSPDQPLHAVIGRTDPNEQESVVLQPELEGRIPV
jgi:uncharacterized RmlC-like cupin family protein